MRKNRSFLESALFFPFGYIVGTTVAAFIWILVALGFIRIKGYKNVEGALAKRDEINGGMIVLSNHPLWVEVFLLPAIVGFPRFILRPFRYFSWSAPKQSLMKVPPLFLMRTIGVPRGKPSKMRSFMEKMAYRLHVKKEIITFFFEGGRTGSNLDELIEGFPKLMRSIKDGYEQLLTNKNYCAEADATRVVGLATWIEITKGWFPKIEIRFAKPRLGSELTKDVLLEIMCSLCK